MKASLILLAIALCGCQDDPQQLVPVRIVSVWTTADYEQSKSWQATFPHVICERTDTGERVMILRETWGKVGDEFKIDAKRILKP